MFAREAKRTAAPVTDGRRKRQVPGVDYDHSELCQVCMIAAPMTPMHALKTLAQGCCGSLEA